MDILEQRIRTVEDFIRFAQEPEQAARRLEFINGKVVEKVGSTTRNAQIPMLLSAIVITYCEAHELPCFVSGADGEYCIGDWCFIPDFAYKVTPVSAEFPDRTPPLWAVEVISARENPAEKRRKYIEMGILLWEIYADDPVIDVYAPGEAPRSYGMGRVVPVSAVPGLSVEVSRLFR